MVAANVVEVRGALVSRDGVSARRSRSPGRLKAGQVWTASRLLFPGSVVSYSVGARAKKQCLSPHGHELSEGRLLKSRIRKEAIFGD